MPTHHDQRARRSDFTPGTDDHPGGQRHRHRHPPVLLPRRAFDRGLLPHLPGARSGQPNPPTTTRSSRFGRQAHAHLPDAVRRTAWSSTPTAPKAVANQKAVMEYLLINHPLDCPVCDQAGECFLQDYSYRVRPRRVAVRGAEGQAAQEGPRPARLSLHRPLHHVHALRPLHARGDGHGGADGAGPRQQGRDRHLPRRRARQRALGQRDRPLPGGRACSTRTSCSPSASGSSRARRASTASPRAATTSTSSTTRARSTASSRATTWR